MKYVMLDKRHPVLFPDFLTHASFIAAARLERKSITSAGSVVVNDGEVKCFGDSVSLKLKSKPVDSIFIKMMFDGIFESMNLLMDV